jgi:oxygen-dependent protoporphyrinogen oxidase
MESFMAAILARLPEDAVRLNSPIERLERVADGAWRLSVAGAAPALFDAVILATPSRTAAALLAGVDSALGAELAGIEHASSAVVALAYQRRKIGWPLHGFGFVVPACERRRILAGSFASEKFPGRAPRDEVLIRVFLGGELQAELLEQTDEALARIATEELADLLRTSGPPQWSEVIRWPSAMPLYHLGHPERVARIEQAIGRLPGIGLAGNAYHGVGVPQCVASGEQAAERLAATLKAPASLSAG